MGYPTANISLPKEATLAHGIYAVRVQLEDGTIHQGVASYGRRPTFDNGEALLEAFIFDFPVIFTDKKLLFISRHGYAEKKSSIAQRL